MKRLSFLIIFLFYSSTAHAILIDNLDGTITDDDFGIMWLADANLAAIESFGVSGINTNGQMTWGTANNWIAGMNTSNYLGYSNWRLPTAFNQDGSGPDFGADNGTGLATDSEMGHLFYNEFGGTAQSTVFGAPIFDLQNNSAPIFNMHDNTYWTSTEFSSGINGDAWHFNFGGGNQGIAVKSHLLYVLPVRDNFSAPIPEPTTIALLGICLAGLAGAKVRRRREKIKQLNASL